MSSVTINELAWDYKHNTLQKELMESCDIEIVPRKMVEMIIAECNSQISDFHHNPSIVNTAIHIKDYALSLLQQFEDNDFSTTEKCLVEPLPFD